LSGSNRLSGPLAAQIGPALGDWRPRVEAFAASQAGQRVLAAVDARTASGAAVYPARVFRALEETPLARTRVVVIGQDPYHGEGQADGLAFSVPAGTRVPPSLRNILAEVRRDLALPALGAQSTGSLAAWARQGVLLLNTALTVEDGRAGSHSKLGWQTLTESLVKAALDDSAPKVFMLWGAHAQGAAPVAGWPERHLRLQANHPSPLSARRGPVPFLGCGHFSRADAFLRQQRGGAVRWLPLAEP
jgi:uracil-DNA glycosylase